MFALMLWGCGSGEWNVETRGEEYIEEEIPAEVFEDGCAVTYDTFLIDLTEASLLDGNGDSAGDVPTDVFEMTTPGPQDVGSASVDATHYSTARFRISPSNGSSVEAAGTLTCPGSTVAFDWAFETDTTYFCEPEDLTIPAGGEATTQLTIHGDHLFYDGLENPDAVVRGVAIAEADADADGTVTLAELDAVNVAGLGYQVGQYSDVSTLGEFVTFLTQTLGHIDGEGHCHVNL
jgi:hypothetical protein